MHNRDKPPIGSPYESVRKPWDLIGRYHHDPVYDVCYAPLGPRLLFSAGHLHSLPEVIFGRAIDIQGLTVHIVQIVLSPTVDIAYVIIDQDIPQWFRRFKTEDMGNVGIHSLMLCIGGGMGLGEWIIQEGCECFSLGDYATVMGMRWSIQKVDSIGEINPFPPNPFQPPPPPWESTCCFFRRHDDPEGHPECASPKDQDSGSTCFINCGAPNDPWVVIGCVGGSGESCLPPCKDKEWSLGTCCSMLFKDEELIRQINGEPDPAKPPLTCFQELDLCPPLVCCPRPDYGYAVETLNIWQTANYGVNTATNPPSYNPNELAVAQLILRDDPDLLLLAGNHRYAPAEYKTSVEPFFGQMRDRGYVLPVPGDRDYAPNLFYSDYFNLAQYFPPNTQVKTYFKFTLGDADFFMLDSGMDSNDVTQQPDMLPKPSQGLLWSYGPCGTREFWIHGGGGGAGGSVEFRWLANEAMASKARWKIVCIHHPPFTSGTIHGSYVDLQWPFADLGIDLVLSGHESLYERIERDGVTYIVNGLGGAGITPFGELLLGTKARYNGGHGALSLRISKRVLSARFLTTDGITKDRFKLIKSDGN